MMLLSVRRSRPQLAPFFRSSHQLVPSFAFYGIAGAIAKKSYMSNTGDDQPRRIAVIGGGITGLATTYYAAKRFPNAKITLFESSDRLGGVIQSHAVPLENGTTAVCEMGPRTLRANASRAIVLIDLIRELGLETELRLVSKSDPIASVRYIYYPDYLVALPVANLLKSVAHLPAPERLDPFRLWKLVRTLLTEPLFSGLLKGVLRGFFVKRPASVLEDDSVNDLLRRRIGHDATENLCSAIFHGLYAGDMRDLSARALCPGLWALEGELTRSPWRIAQCMTRHDKLPTEVWKEDESAFLASIRVGATAALERSTFKNTAVFSFAGGIGRLTERLAASVRAMDNVKMNTSCPIRSVSKNGSVMSLETAGSTHDQHSFSHVICTTYLPITLKFLRANDPSRFYSKPTISHVPIMTVSLLYSTPNLNHPYRGFGYLLPSSLPRSQSPENALGVIFDSDAIPNIDNFNGTKISVMLGGHYWTRRASLPSTEEGTEMAKTLLKRHMGISEEPVSALARLKKTAIPQYHVGHYRMLREIHRVLAEFGGQVRIAGNCYDGIGVHDCLYSARRVVEGLGEKDRTGLEWCR